MGGNTIANDKSKEITNHSQKWNIQTIEQHLTD